MSKTVKFEGKLEIEGTPLVVERALSALARMKAVEIGPGGFGHRHYPDWWNGEPVPLDITAVMANSNFLQKQLTGRMVYGCDNPRGGRMYPHVHLDNGKTAILTKVQLNKLVRTALKEVGKLRSAHSIP